MRGKRNFLEVTRYFVDIYNTSNKIDNVVFTSALFDFEDRFIYNLGIFTRYHNSSYISKKNLFHKRDQKMV